MVASTHRHEPHVLYRAFGSNGRLIYVGITHDWIKRLYAHWKATWWWSNEVAAVTTTPCPNYEVARVAEAEAIRSERPARNVQHNRG